LILKGQTPAGLADLVECSTGTLYNLLEGSSQSRRLRLRIELILKTPIWSGARELALRLRILDRFGVDLWLCSFRRLQLLAKEKHIAGWSRVKSKVALIELISKYFRDHLARHGAGRRARGRKK